MYKLLFCVVAVSMWWPVALHSQRITNINPQYLHLIKDAYTINSTSTQAIWPNKRNIPFTVLLVTEEFEYLINHPNPSADFELLEPDSILNTPIYIRNRQYGINFLATFPAVNGVNCIVVGTPENTNTTPLEWISTLLHEHFHQFQFSRPNWYEDLNQLDISGGDKTGMWMLNYKFPYENKKVNKRYMKYTNSLYKAIHSPNQVRLKALIKNRRLFKKSISVDDGKYFSMQIWTEGIARYSEYQTLRHFISQHLSTQPSLHSTKPNKLMQFNAGMLQMEMEKLVSQKLSDKKRLCFYSVGFAEAILLDQVKPNWRSKYFDYIFQLEDIL